MFGGKKEQRHSKTSSGPIWRCSFCNKSQHDVKHLIAGPNVFICDECVDICVDVINHPRSSGIDGPAPLGIDGPASSVLSCGLCRTPTTLEQSLAVTDRGIICEGCVGAIEAALEERNETT
jgi:hypothetical protein